MDYKELSILASKIVNDFKDKPYINDLFTFPDGCCGVVSVAFGKFLNDRGLINVKRGNGQQCGKQNSHMWLEYNDFIIDLTINQFNEYKECTEYVFKERLPIHKTFKNNRNILSCDVSIYDDVVWIVLERIQKICE